MEFKPKQSDYTFSEPVIIREWSGGKGCISVRIGYVREHPEHNQIVLFKKWPGTQGKSEEYKYYIKGKDDWHAIRQAVESLWPDLENNEEIDTEQINAAVEKVSSEVGLLDLLTRFPELLSKVPADIDILNMPDQQKSALRKFMATSGEVADKVIEKMSEQPVSDIEDFLRILEETRLATINSLVNHIKSRLTFIDNFEIAINNDSTFERRGDDSIHNLLRANMWILDRNYTILNDDVTLKNIINQRLDPNTIVGDEELGTRPDFLCMISRREAGKPIAKMVIIEIKRPSVSLRMGHMEQLMGYKSILDAHSGNSVIDFDCYLVGRQKVAAFQNVDLSASGYSVKTYTDFIGEARQFYEEYLEILQAETLAI
ncbi:hypothetical protein BH23PAT1_BH23PAT1_0030 [soil metagenome]